MGITYLYCIECETCYVDCHCENEGHHMIYSYKSENPTIAFINFIKERDLLNDFLKYIEKYTVGWGNQYCLDSY